LSGVAGVIDRRPIVVPAEGDVLEQSLQSTWTAFTDGLSRPAYGRLEAASLKTAWGRRHQHRFALVTGTELLATATRYNFTAVLDQRTLSICGIGAVFTEPERRGEGHAGALVARLIDEAAREGAELALLFSDRCSSWCARSGFEVIPTTQVAITVNESPRYGAPMTLVRGGEERDLAAIVTMGRVRAEPFRFHLDRDADRIQHAITRKRLQAGLGPAGARELHFFIAEEGITAAAYVVITVAANTWTIEECGDRDPSGARVGAILQALIAREAAERRPSIRGWLPPGFAPPQLTITAVAPSAEVLMVRSLTSRPLPTQLTPDTVLYWRTDLF
jgi:GNAT superfamily N-acetyltransferase